MRRAPALAIALALVAGLGACARDSGGWPSLAPRPAERRPVEPDPILPARASTPGETAQPGTPSDPAAPAALARLRPRIATTRAALARALGRAAHAKPDAEAWAAAEVELSRAEQLLGDLDDLLPRFGSRAATALAPADAQTERAALSRAIEAAKRALVR